MKKVHYTAYKILLIGLRGFHMGVLKHYEIICKLSSVLLSLVQIFLVKNKKCIQVQFLNRLI